MDLNPFDLRGPEFLTFYCVFGGAMLLVLAAWIRWWESSPGSGLPAMTDPYLIGHLRGGERAAMDSAVVAMIDRALLQVEEPGRLVATRAPDLFSLRPLERALLALFQNRGTIYDAYGDGKAMAVCDGYRATLEREGLILSNGARAHRRIVVALVVIALYGVAVTKIAIALNLGRFNVLFLIMLAVSFTFMAMHWNKGRRTTRGQAVFTDLRSLFQRLENPGWLRPGQNSNDLAYAVALFGTAGLSTDAFPHLQHVLPPPPKKAKSDGGSGCGSSCGSGSSCGGDSGGGGGCGGCGGD